MTVPQVECVAVVGAGTQGSRIAFRCALRGKQVRLYDALPTALGKATALHHALLEERMSDGRLLSDEANAVLARLKICDSLDQCLARAGIVIEAVPEKLELKRKVFSDMDALADSQVIFATNSSSIPSSQIASATGRPDRILNINFSDPSSDDDLLVEVMRSTETSERTLAITVQFIRSLGMVPVITRREIMGFSFNRIWRAIKREALHLVDEGYSDFMEIDRAWMLEFHTPYGPFGLMDWIGLDVIRDIETQYYLNSGDERDRPPKLLDDLIAQGRTGFKAGHGFYTYPNPVYRSEGWLRKDDV